MISEPSEFSSEALMRDSWRWRWWIYRQMTAGQLWNVTLTCLISLSLSVSLMSDMEYVEMSKKEKILLWQSHAISRLSRLGLVISLEKNINSDVLQIGEKLRKMWMSKDPLSEFVVTHRELPGLEILQNMTIKTEEVWILISSHAYHKDHWKTTLFVYSEYKLYV